MDVIGKTRLAQILEMQIAKLEDMKQKGEAADRIANQEFEIKCTRRRLERAGSADYDEEISEVKTIGG